MNQDAKKTEKSAKIFRRNQPVVMGILNITPDSFFDGGRFSILKNALKQAAKMIDEGADILDLGAVSTRPFADEVSEEEEWNRLKMVLPALRKQFPDILISVDTYRSAIARQSVLEGADMINDISGGQYDEEMFRVITESKAAYVMMHIKGTPKNMQQNPVYENVVSDVVSFFGSQLQKMEKAGLTKNIILDPGFGFGKTVEHNYQLVHGIQKIKTLGFPVLAGLSRKSMINRVLGIKPANALNGTTALNLLALVNGATILRVHDVKEAVEAIKLFEVYQENQII